MVERENDRQQDDNADNALGNVTGNRRLILALSCQPPPCLATCRPILCQPPPYPANRRRILANCRVILPTAVLFNPPNRTAPPPTLNPNAFIPCRFERC